MRDTFKVINDLENAGMIRRYAIGGAVAAIFYMEAFETEDLDILILLPPDKEKSLNPLSDIYRELRLLGFKEDGPFMDIHGIPVQFLVAYNPLVEEAVESAVDIDFEGITTRVPTAEYLGAIMIQTGRAKDRARFQLLRENVSLDFGVIEPLISKHGLTETYNRWMQL